MAMQSKVLFLVFIVNRMLCVRSEEGYELIHDRLSSFFYPAPGPFQSVASIDKPNQQSRVPFRRCAIYKRIDRR